MLPNGPPTLLEHLKQKYMEEVGAVTTVAVLPLIDSFIKFAQDYLDKNPVARFLLEVPGTGIQLKDTTLVKVSTKAPVMGPAREEPRSTAPEEMGASMRGEPVHQLFGAGPQTK